MKSKNSKVAPTDQATSAGDETADTAVRKNVSSLAEAAAGLAAAWDREGIADPALTEAEPVAMTDEEKEAFEKELGGAATGLDQARALSDTEQTLTDTQNNFSAEE